MEKFKISYREKTTTGIGGIGMSGLIIMKISGFPMCKVVMLQIIKMLRDRKNGIKVFIKHNKNRKRIQVLL